METFIKGLLIGLSVSAPVDPIGFLCIQRTLTQGMKVGLATGLGATFADFLYGLVAAFGMSKITVFFMSEAKWFRLFGGAFLFYLGVKIIFKKKTSNSCVDSNLPMWQAFLTTFLLMISNPLTILFFLSVFSGVSSAETYFSKKYALVLSCGVGIGSGLWWLGLSAFVVRFREKLTIARLQKINIIAGVVFCGFGFWTLQQVIRLL